MIKIKKKYNIIEYITLFAIIYLSSSFVGIAMNGTINLTLTIMITIISFLLNIKKIKFSTKMWLLILILITLTLISVLLNQDNLYDYIIFLIPLICGFIISNIIEPKLFIKYYDNILYFLSIFSIITFLIINIVPNLLNYFPITINQSGIVMKNLFFSVVYNNSYFNSNYGLFWEPGAYQIFVNIALFFQLFLFKTINKKRVAIYILTIVTTFSTTGYFGLFFLIIIYFLSNNNLGKKRIKNILYIFIFLFISYFIVKNLSENIYFKVFGKLEALFNSSLLTNNQSFISTNIRVNSLKIPLDAFLSNPLFGISFTKLNKLSLVYGQSMLTATPLNWFGLFGLPGGIIFIILNWNWVKNIEKKWYIKILLLLFLLFIVVTENFNRNAFYFLFLFIGMKDKIKRGIDYE